MKMFGVNLELPFPICLSPKRAALFTYTFCTHKNHGSIKSCTYFYEPEQMITRFDPNDEYSLLNTGISVMACRVRGICYDTGGFYEKKYNKFDRRVRSKKPKRIKDL